MLESDLPQSPRPPGNLALLEPQIRRIARILAKGDPELADEIAQLTLIKVWKAEATGTLPEPVTPGWLWTVAQSARNDIFRKRKSIREDQDDGQDRGKWPGGADISQSSPAVAAEWIRLATEAAGGEVHKGACYAAWWLFEWKPSRIVREFAGLSYSEIAARLAAEFTSATGTPAEEWVLEPLKRALRAAPESPAMHERLSVESGSDVAELVSEWVRGLGRKLATELKRQDKECTGTVLGYGKPHHAMAFLAIHALGLRPALAAQLLNRTHGEAATAIEAAYMAKMAERHGDGLGGWFNPLHRRLTERKLAGKKIPFAATPDPAVQASGWSAKILKIARKDFVEGKLSLLFAERLRLMAKWGVE